MYVWLYKVSPGYPLSENLIRSQLDNFNIMQNRWVFLISYECEILGLKKIWRITTLFVVIWLYFSPACAALIRYCHIFKANFIISSINCCWQLTQHCILAVVSVSDFAWRQKIPLKVHYLIVNLIYQLILRLIRRTL